MTAADAGASSDPAGLLDLNAGALAPVADEVEVLDLRVEGELPSALNGRLLRVGPNPRSGRFDGRGMLNWWTGAAMVHGLSLAEGRAGWYRNRWIGSEETNPNVNIIRRGGEVLALAEMGRPEVLGPDLGPRGPASFAADLPGGMCAHPKIDARTDELTYVMMDWRRPVAAVGILGPGGHRRFEIDLDRSVMMHDLAVTASSVILLDLNVVYDLALLAAGISLPLRWEGNRPARLGVVGRVDGAVQWFAIEPCFIQHVVNAYEEDGAIVLDAVRYPTLLVFDSEQGQHRPDPLGILWRYRLELSTGRVTETQLDDRHVELPRIDERLTGRRHRFVHAVEQPTDREMRGVVSYDLERGTTATHAVAPGDQNSEFVFAPDPDRHGETAGWLLGSVYRAERDANDIVVLDAGDPGSAPVAVIHLPRRIPAGFHGAWLADRPEVDSRW